MKKAILPAMIYFSLAAILAGCAEIKPPSPETIMRQPLGEGPLRIGMSKEQIKSLWGNPDYVKVLDEDGQATVKEEWVYRGRYPRLPINVGYLAETQNLIFDGNNLVKFYHRK